ncbi:MAG TPA: 4-hydroxybenzoate octaprenyltransferase [Candidatus Eisenbacteria bacterium]|nr:4-hydroxybenzoate octaprenyltransferase [Candidatus Eisenbacteria bacterium]
MRRARSAWIGDFIVHGRMRGACKVQVSTSRAWKSILCLPMNRPRGPWQALTDYARFVKLEHTLFSLPLIVAGALIGRAGAALTWGRLGLLLLAGAGARTFALAINRIVDRALDAHNPRTAARELPGGRMRLIEAWGVALAGLAVYVVAAALLPRICLYLSPIPLAVFVGYPYLKRFTPLCHLGVGLALALSPLGGYVAVTGTLEGVENVLPLAGFALLWVAGFDVIYATLDEAHDRAHGVRSLPAAIGSEKALMVSRAFHTVAFALLAGWAIWRGSGVWMWLCLAAVGALLLWEQKAARKVELAFFQINSWLGFVVLAFIWAGLT